MSSNVQALIQQAAQTGGVDPTLALAVAQHESGFNQAAVGTSGEQGVFQIMPSTAQDLGIDPTNLQQNIAGGTSILAHNLATFGGDRAKALAAYNCGVTCVANAVAAGGDNWFAHVPWSTQEYVLQILGAGGAPAPATQAADATSGASAVPPSPYGGASAGVPVLALVGAGLLAALALAGG